MTCKHKPRFKNVLLLNKKAICRKCGETVWKMPATGLDWILVSIAGFVGLRISRFMEEILLLDSRNLLVNVIFTMSFVAIYFYMVSVSINYCWGNYREKREIKPESVDSKE